MILIIDAHGVMFRVCGRIEKEPIINARGENITGLYGIIGYMRDLLRRFDEVEEIVFAWDGQSQARKDIFPEYKAQRQPTSYSAAVHQQINIVKNGFLMHFGVKQLHFEHIEADDVIGILSKALSGQGRENTIISGDKDMLQLIGPCCNVYSYIKQKLITMDNVKRITGLMPQNLVEYLSLVGDNEDNIRGVDGIGEKWGKKIVDRYGTIEKIAEHADGLRLCINSNAEDKALAKKALGLLDPAVQETVKFNRSLIKLGCLMSNEDNRLILGEYLRQKVVFNKEAVQQILQHYQLMEYQQQITDLAVCFGNMQHNYQSSTYCLR